MSVEKKRLLCDKPKNHESILAYSDMEKLEEYLEMIDPKNPWLK